MKSIRQLLLLSLLSAAGQAGAAGLSEQDYFSELPTVLTVTRLAQPLSETPGAVTIIDRETIRRSGAREVTDLLRLVPGYMVGGFNGANPSGAYHAPIDTYGTRNLVLVDGRSIYSVHYAGSTHRGMLGLLLEDIERIEILRGSNSAAYGANAMYGVINIVTRHTSDTRGAEMSVTSGNGGISDEFVRVGWGNDTATFRLSAGKREDNGYFNAYDDKSVSQVHFRSDMRPTHDQELRITGGGVRIHAGEGEPGNAKNPARTTSWEKVYLQGDWQRQMTDSEQVKLSASFDTEDFFDEFLYPAPKVIIGSSGKAQRINLEAQKISQPSTSVRYVLGAGYKREENASFMVYAHTHKESMNEAKLFGNVEWRPHPQWLINAGAFIGDHSRIGSYFSPRLMTNFLLTPDHVFRAGVGKSVRPPALLELAGDVEFGGIRLLRGSPDLRPEKLLTKEFGYFGNLRDWRMTVDVRFFDERMADFVDKRGSNPEVFYNKDNFRIHGYEYQLRWKPFVDTEVILNQSSLQLDWSNSRDANNQPPNQINSLAIFQRLPDGYDLSLIYHEMEHMSWGSMANTLPARHRVDVRLAKTLRLGSTKAEAAFVVQQNNGNVAEYLLDKRYLTERRAFGTLRLEF